MSRHPHAEPDHADFTWAADDVMRDALQLVADGITELAGFEVAAVSVVRAEDQLQVMAVSGSYEARSTLLGTITPISRLLEELRLADDWGRFKFVPAERLDPAEESWGWVPDMTPIEGEDAWDPMDLLVAPLHDGLGQLIGSLSIDLPADRRRPGRARRRILDRYAEQGCRALVLALERERLAEQVRLAESAREVVRKTSRSQSIRGLLQQVQPALFEGFRASGTWIHTFDEDGHGLGAVYASDGTEIDMPRDLVKIAERAAEDAWREQHVPVLSRTTATGVGVTPSETNQILDFLDGIGVGTLMLVPMGAGDEALGSLVLTRATDAVDWSTVEVEAALDVGRDLGQAILNARAFEREREAVRELQALDAYKNNLIATLSHGLKSPLAAITANLGLLENTEGLDPQVQQVIAAVDRGANRLARVTDDLLLLAKVGDPGRPLSVKPVALPTVVQDALDLTSIAAQRRVSLEAVGDPSAMVVRGSARELDIVVTNLVSNAVKYTPDDGVVAVTLSRSGDEVVLTVCDEGIGICAEDQEHLFEEFYRARCVRVEKLAGTGLGLTIVDRIVRRHRGRIEVESALGEGSTFRVILPAG